MKEKRARKEGSGQKVLNRQCQQYRQSTTPPYCSKHGFTVSTTTPPYCSTRCFERQSLVRSN